MKRGPGVRKGKRLGPMRRVVRVLRFPDGIFDTYHVEFECGHKGHVWSDTMAHCRKCLAKFGVIKS